MGSGFAAQRDATLRTAKRIQLRRGERRMSLPYLRSEFAVSDACPNSHAWPDIADRSDHIAFCISRDAVAAPECGVGSKDAENAFCSPKALPCIVDFLFG